VALRLRVSAGRTRIAIAVAVIADAAQPGRNATKATGTSP
jgi:hypothetical protein